MTTLVEPLLELMERHSLDFTSTLRTLTQFPTVRTDDLIERVLDNSTMCDLVRATDDFERWLGRYAARLEQGSWTEEERREWNPRFALRQWVLEEAIERMQKGQPDARRHLARVLKVRSFSASLSLPRAKLTIFYLACMNRCHSSRSSGGVARASGTRAS